MRAIIIGATGTIGSALVKKLVSENHEVLVLLRPGSNRSNHIKSHPLVTIRECDLTDLATLNPTDSECYDVFYFFAWAGTTGAARNDMYLQNQNVTYALDAVGAAHRFGCRLFVGAGSQAEYGIPVGNGLISNEFTNTESSNRELTNNELHGNGLPDNGIFSNHFINTQAHQNLTPNTATRPFTGYGYAKLCAGMMTRDYAHSLGMAHTWVRILSIYGENDSSVSLISTLIQKLHQKEEPACTAGEQIWDYLYNEDAAEAFLSIGTLAERSGIDGKTFVLGSGKAAPLKEYINILHTEMISAGLCPSDSGIAFGAIPYSPQQVMYLCGDISALTEATGWVPRTEFAEGIRRTILASLQ